MPITQLTQTLAPYPMAAPEMVDSEDIFNQKAISKLTHDIALVSQLNTLVGQLNNFIAEVNTAVDIDALTTALDGVNQSLSQAQQAGGIATTVVDQLSVMLAQAEGVRSSSLYALKLNESNELVLSIGDGTYDASAFDTMAFMPSSGTFSIDSNNNLIFSTI